MLQLIAGALTIVADILAGIYGWAGATIKEIQPSPHVEVRPKHVFGLQLSALAIGGYSDFKGINWANPFMGVQERMKPADTACTFDIAFLGNISRGTNTAFKVAGLVNWDTIFEKYSAPADENGKVKQSDKPPKSVQEAQPWKKDSTERALEYQPGKEKDYLGQSVGAEKGLFIAGAANIMPETAVVGLQAAGLVNFAGSMDGVQIAGFSNTAGTLRGVQIALWCNEADDGAGLQIGLLNNGRAMKGLQIGIINFFESTPDAGRFLPIVNANF